MNAKTIFICLAILAVLTCSVQSITMGKHHKSQSHKARVFAESFSHKLMSAHFQADGPQIPDDVIQDFMAFVMGDKEIMDSIMNGKPLSSGAAKKVQNFFINNKSFNDAMVKGFDQDPSFPQCYKDLNQGQKRKFITILIQQMDFEKLLNGDDSQPTDEDVKRIKSAIDADKDLGPKVSKCLEGHIELPSVA